MGGNYFVASAKKVEADGRLAGSAFAKVGTSVIPIAAGMQYRIMGSTVSHAQHGVQFKVTSIQEEEPVDKNSLVRLLKGKLSGVGTVKAQAIVDAFGATTLDVLDSDNAVRRLAALPGLRTIAESIKREWDSSRVSTSALVFLTSHGLSSGAAQRAIRKLGAGCEAAVRMDPYRALRGVQGIDFATLDKLAARISEGPFEAERPSRLEAALLQTLATMFQTSGSTFMRSDEALAATVGLLRRSGSPAPGLDGIRSVLPALEKDRAVVWERPADRLYLAAAHAAERSVAAWLGAAAAASKPSAASVASAKDALAKVLSKGPQLSVAQRAAVLDATTSRLMIITGGPGTGKTLVLGVLVRTLQELGKTVAVMAPTGLAAYNVAQKLALQQEIHSTSAASAQASNADSSAARRESPAARSRAAAALRGKGAALGAEKHAAHQPSAQAVEMLGPGTIHRVLGFIPLETLEEDEAAGSRSMGMPPASDPIVEALMGGQFKFQRGYELPVDYVVVDEASMMDLALSYGLLSALQRGTQLLLVGVRLPRWPYLASPYT